jgi:hypothetical protein
MSTVKAKFGPNNQPITITLDSLSAGDSQCSLAIDNTINKFLDALVVIQTVSPIGQHAGQVRVWVYGSSNGGSDYGDGVPGTDSLVTLTEPRNLHLIGVMTMPNPSSSLGTVYTSNPMSVAMAFSGRLPDHWGIVVENHMNNNAFGPSGNSAWYQGTYEQVG